MADELRGRLSLCERPTFLQQYDRPRASVSEHRHEPTLLSEFNEQSHSFRPYVQVDSVQEPHHVAYSAEIEDDFNEYQTMDSASTRSSGSGTEFDIPNPSMEDNETEVPGHECLKQHAKNNDEGLEAMFCSNEFIENVTTAKEWDQNASYDAPVVENVVTLTESTHSTELHEGLIFHTKEALQCAINAWSIANNVQYKNLCSNKNRLTITCAHHDNPQRPCAWRLHAARSKRLGGLWRISDCGPQHTCTHAVTMQGHRNCTSKFVCTFITPIVRQQLDIKPREIIARIESKFDIKLSYVKAWDARRKAIQAIFGTYEESYRSLYRFIEATLFDMSTRAQKVEVIETNAFTCTCSKPQLYHIPCAHVIATSRIRHWDYNTLISPYYTLQFYKDSYAEVFHTIPDKDQWPSFTNDHGIIPLIAPAFRRRVGRPRSNRIRTTMDEASNASVRACGFCKNLGHNRATCPNNPGSSRYGRYNR
ncbi:hypothetical protein M5K25_022664 [Dendrobium thyrsiflorum]|uniref:SWIM-type domain-containing protein n=1 Tax=Dendrobium thyrsiflorum TaxID=117978 RepID=A0ABD0UCY8_DENTH